MRKLLTRLLTISVVIAIGAVVVALTASSTIAQTVRAALVKNVDEPGLVPFSQTFTISQSDCGCTNCCFLQTDPVPAGKRLVIQNVSGYFPLAATANMGPFTIAQLDPGTFASTTIATIPLAYRSQWNGGDYPAYECNQLLQGYVDAGKRVRITAYTGGSWNFRSGLVSISGYLVSLQ
jgi:hypothetical protein